MPTAFDASGGLVGGLFCAWIDLVIWGGGVGSDAWERMKKTIAWFRVVLWVGVFGLACQPKPPPKWLTAVPDAQPIGMYHRVEAGQTLYSICKKYSADLQEVAEINGIEEPSQIRVGQELFIPDLDLGRAKSPGPRPRPKKQLAQLQGDFIWPVEGVVTSKFGIRRGRRHDGIDLSAPTGTPIVATADGKVLYVGRQGGYGNLVILEHAHRVITVYAHNHKNLVKESQRVKQGQKIALVGHSGRATGPHVHFEIRLGTKPRNPLFYLPRPAGKGKP